MWIAVLVGGWVIVSLLASPWIGRFIAARAGIHQQPPAPAMPMAAAKPDAAEIVPLARRA